MKNEIVKLETAKLLKELGFDWGCNNAYVNLEPYEKFDNTQTTYMVCQNHNSKKHRISVPTKALTQKYLREVHNYHIRVDDFLSYEDKIIWDYEITIIGTDLDEKGNYTPLVSYGVVDEREFKNYEEALEIGIFRCLKIIQNEQKIKTT